MSHKWKTPSPHGLSKLIKNYSMVNLRVPRHPIISYRPIRPSDLPVLEQLHADLFPINYESEFFHNVVDGRDIVSWGAVDRSRPNGQSDELIGFVTAKIVIARESEERSVLFQKHERGSLYSCIYSGCLNIDDLFIFDTSKTDQTLVYILTLGVVESYRNFGIAHSLISEVIKYASSIPSCRAVYLHVISYNNPAIHLYKKMSFQCVRRLSNFYYINEQHYDAYLFVYYVNGGRSPCSPLELITEFVTYLMSRFKSMAAKLCRNEERKNSKWPKCKETGYLLPMVQDKRCTDGSM